MKNAKNDELTQVLNKNTIEKLINHSISKGGTLFLCDILELRSIIQKDGYLKGDQVIQESARILGFVIRQNDILGRINENRFVIFSQNFKSDAQANTFALQVENRFKSQNQTDEIKIKITITYGIAKKNDNYASLLKRVEKSLESQDNSQTEEKISKLRCFNLAKKDLSTLETSPFKDYDSFKLIHNFIHTTNQNASLAMIIVQEQNFEKKEEIMNQLKNTIEISLQNGDIFCRYSSCQYLLLLLNKEQNKVTTFIKQIINPFELNTTISYYSCDI